MALPGVPGVFRRILKCCRPSVCGRVHQLSCRNWSSNPLSTGTPLKPGGISLSEPLPGLPLPVYSTVHSHDEETQITVMSNGLKVASQKKFGQFCTLGVVIDSGSRYEVAYPNGVSHFLEKLAFNSTIQFSDKDVILQELEKHGGICDCQGSRDTMIYAASCDSRGLDPVVQLLGEVVLRPRLSNQEVDLARQTILFELQDIEMRPEQEPILLEMIHAAAYRDNTLGLPKLCPKESVTAIERPTLLNYLKHHYTPERMVVAGVGVEHGALLEAVQRHFVEKPAIWEQDPSVAQKPDRIDQSLSQYTGGVEKVERDLSNVSLGPSPIPELAHFVLGFESCSHQDADFIPFCVLNMMMGGGGSFSAGGPGKGMYTRLYTNVLNRYHWMYNATAYNHAYNDSGIFCIHAGAHPSQLRELVEVIVKEFVSMTGRISQDEFNRAKCQLKSMLLMNLEARPIVFEDIARQVLATGHRKPPGHYIQEIGKVTEDDVRRVALRMLESKASVAALGDLKDLPTMDSIHSALTSKEGRIGKRFSIFRR